MFSRYSHYSVASLIAIALLVPMQFAFGQEYSNASPLHHNGDVLEQERTIPTPRNALVNAIKAGDNVKAYELISKQLVDIRATTLGVKKMTFLHLAAKVGVIDIAEYLLDAGADLYALDARKETVFDYAERREDMQEFLKSRDIKGQFAYAHSSENYPDYSSRYYSNSDHSFWNDVTPGQKTLIYGVGVVAAAAACCCVTTVGIALGGMYIIHTGINTLFSSIPTVPPKKAAANDAKKS